MKIPQLKCKRCGHVWYPRIPDVKKCPNRNCQSVRWNEDPKNDPKDGKPEEKKEQKPKKTSTVKTKKKKGKKSAS